MSRKPETKLHPGHHWGPFAKDPWSPDLDPVVGELWERACRAGRMSLTAEPARPRGDEPEKTAKP